MRIKMIQKKKRIVGKMKILLVDDERTEREGIWFLIEKFQFELEVAKRLTENWQWSIYRNIRMWIFY